MTPKCCVLRSVAALSYFIHFEMAIFLKFKWVCIWFCSAFNVKICLYWLYKYVSHLNSSDIILKNVKCFDFLKCKSAFLIDYWFFFLQAILMPDILLLFQVICIVVNVQDCKTVLLLFQYTNLLTLIKQQLLEIFFVVEWLFCSDQ